MIRHPKDNSRPVRVTLTQKQLFTLQRVLNELELVFSQQYFSLTPVQKREIRIAIRHLDKFRCWRVIETALAKAQD